MDKDKLHILNLIIGMWENDLINENGSSDFEIWCEDNLENEKQIELMKQVCDHVNTITYLLDDEEEWLEQ